MTPLGGLKIEVQESGIESITFLHRTVVSKTDFSVADPRYQLVVALISQLENYFCHNSKHRFSVPITLSGTPLQIKIWRRIAKIPGGSTESYGALAQEFATSPRVIGNACRKNPVPLLIPCHRVIASNGRLGGYCGTTGGKQLKIKAWLLAHEETHN